MFRTLLLAGAGQRTVLEGVMDRIWVRWFWLESASRVLGMLGLLPGRTGRDVPVILTITGYRGLNGWARQVWRRHFEFGRPRRMTTTTEYDATRGVPVDRLGPQGMFELAWRVGFDPPRTLTLAGTSWRLRLGPLGLPLPSKLIGLPRVTHTAVGADEVHIDFVNEVPLLREVFGYEGTFRVHREAR